MRTVCDDDDDKCNDLFLKFIKRVSSVSLPRAQHAINCELWLRLMICEIHFYNCLCSEAENVEFMANDMMQPWLPSIDIFTCNIHKEVCGHCLAIRNAMTIFMMM